MKKRVLKVSILCFLSTLFINRSFGQAALSDSTFLQTTVSQTVTNFYKSIGQQSRLYNGHEYHSYDHHIIGNALFPYDVQSWEPGEVNYDGIVYKNVPLMYDIYKDIVVVLLYNKFSMYTLLDDKVHNFSFANHHFVRVNTDSLSNNNSGITTGFYDQLYGGKTEALVKRVKTLQNTSSSIVALETSFISNNTYYLRKGNAYYKVSSQGAILNVLKDKKSELQQYIKTNDIRFNKDPDDALAKIAAYYDRITN